MLEGNFNSLYQNRIPISISSDSAIGFVDKSSPTAMIIISDGDVIRNDIQFATLTPFPLGYDEYMKKTFANKTFILNCMNYLCDGFEFLNLRSRDIQLRTLDRKKLKNESGKWKAINVVVPIVSVMALGFVLIRLRKRKIDSQVLIMNKKLFTYIFVLILVGLTAFIFIKKSKKTTLESESGDFKYNDTAAITKIFIAEKNGATATLERKDKGNWTINGQFAVRKNNVNLLLYTLKQIAVKFPAGEKLQPTIIQSIATVGKKIEFYGSGNERVKVWYLGATTPDYTGTYMVLADPDTDEKYEQTYVTYIPGSRDF